MTDTYRLAQKTVRISTLFEAPHELCRDYRIAAEGEPDFSVEITPEDIEREREKATRPCSDPYLEILAVYRKIAEKMPAYDTVLVHGSAIAVDGEAYLFTARSGTGKSTHARLWRELLGERAVMVNDDKPLLHIADGRATVFGTPWNGKHRLGANIAVPLKAVCLLTRAEDNFIVPIEKSEAYPELIRQIYRPADPEALRATLSLIDSLTQVVGLYRLGCNMEPEAARVAFESMGGRL